VPKAQCTRYPAGRSRKAIKSQLDIPWVPSVPSNGFVPRPGTPGTKARSLSNTPVKAGPLEEPPRMRSWNDQPANVSTRTRSGGITNISAHPLYHATSACCQSGHLRRRRPKLSAFHHDPRCAGSQTHGNGRSAGDRHGRQRGLGLCLAGLGVRLRHTCQCPEATGTALGSYTPGATRPPVCHCSAGAVRNTARATACLPTANQAR